MNESEIPEEVLAVLQARGWRPAEGYKKNAGGQATVIEVRHRQKGRGAFRLLKKADEVDVRRFAREVGIVTDARFRHPNVVNILEVASPGEGYWYVSELGKPFGSYWKARKKRLGARRIVPETIAVVRQLAAGLVPLHGQGVVHRDIKPANIVVVGTKDRTRPVLIDFGIAHQDGEERLTALDGAVGPRAFAPDAMRGYLEAVVPWLDVFELAQLLIWMLSVRDGKPHWERPVHWRYVRYPSELDPDIERRVRAVTALCSIEATGPIDAQGLVSLLDSYFPADETVEPSLDGTVGFSEAVRGRVRGQSQYDLRRAEESEIVAACFPAFEKTVRELSAELQAIVSDLEPARIATHVSVDQSPVDRYDELVRLDPDVGAGTTFSVVVGDHPATVVVSLGYVMLIASEATERRLTRPDGANVFAITLSRLSHSGRPSPERLTFVTIETTGQLALRNADLRFLGFATVSEIAGHVRRWINDESLWEQLHSASGPAPSPWRIDDSAFEELDGDERAALCLLGNLNLGRDRLRIIHTDVLIQEAASRGLDVNDIMDAFERLDGRDYVMAERTHRSLPDDVVLLDEGFEVFLAAQFPNYDKLVTEIVSLIVGDDHLSDVHLEVTLGQPRVLLDHVLTRLRDKGYLEADETPPFVKVDDYRALKRWAEKNRIEPRKGDPKCAAIEAFVMEMERILENRDLATLERGWWTSLRNAQRLASESGARDTFAPGSQDDNHKLLQALGRLGFISDIDHRDYVADMNSPQYRQAIAEARAAVEVVYSRVRTTMQ